MWEDAGQLMPMGMAMAWALARISLYNWPLTCATTLALLAATSFALLRVLRTLFGNRPAILLPLTMFLFSPLQLSISWWSMVINILPVELAICMAVDEHVRYLRTGRMRNAVAAAGWLLAGMAACDKGAVVPCSCSGSRPRSLRPGCGRRRWSRRWSGTGGRGCCTASCWPPGPWST